MAVSVMVADVTRYIARSLSCTNEKKTNIPTCILSTPGATELWHTVAVSKLHGLAGHGKVEVLYNSK